MSPELIKYWPWALGGAVGLVVVLKYHSSGSPQTITRYVSAPSSSGASSTVSSGPSKVQLADSFAIAQDAALGTATGQIGSAVAGITKANSYIPAIAINAASANNQMAMMSAAKTSATAFASLPGSLGAAALLLHQSYQPFAQYTGAMASLTATQGSTAVGLSNSLSQSIASQTNAASSASSSASRAINQITQSTNQAISQGGNQKAQVHTSFLNDQAKIRVERLKASAQESIASSNAWAKVQVARANHPQQNNPFGPW